MDHKADWRIDNCRSIEGETFRRKKYKARSEQWDHDHCMACFAKFADFTGPDILHEGYTTTAESKWGEDYHWLCVECFGDLREAMAWREIP